MKEIISKSSRHVTTPVGTQSVAIEERQAKYGEKPVHIYIRGYTNPRLSYGMHVRRVVRDLTLLGCTVHLNSIEPVIGEWPENLQHTIDCKPGPWELLIAPVGTPVTHPRTVFFTMHESTGLSEEQEANLEKANKVITPTQWNSNVFRLSTPRVVVCPLGIDTEVFQPSPMNMAGPFVFGTGGRIQGPGERKQIPRLIEVFRRTFKEGENVELHIKCTEDCKVPDVDDKRIRIHRTFVSDAQLGAWFRNLNAFVNGSFGEGWGLMLHQAMASARPVIGPLFGAPRAFQTTANCFPVSHFLVTRKDGYYRGCTVDWYEEDMMRQMLSVYHNREEVRRCGWRAAHDAAAFPWIRSNIKLLQLLSEYYQ